MSLFIQYPLIQGVATYSTFSAFPATASNGTVALALDTDFLYAFNTGSATWVLIAGAGTILTVGTFDSQSAVASGLQIISNTLYAQSADATHPGMVNTGSQTFAGQKTFSTGLTGTLTGAASLNVLTSALGNLTDAGTDGITVTGGTGATVGAVSLSQHVADTTHNGYLSSTDWTTFNAKQSALTIGNLTDVGTDGITITGGTGAVIGSGASISQHVAGAANNGYLSSADWSAFNGKQAAGNYITALTGDVTASGPGSAASSLVATSNATIVTLSALTTASSLVSVGTITSGTWGATTIALNKGGTGQTTKAPAFDALQPMSTLGDIIYGGASGTGTRLAGDTSNSNKFLRSVSSGGVAAAPTWAALVAADIPSLAASIITSGTLATAQGGTNSNSSASTGIAHVSSGTWTYSAVALGGADVSGTLLIGNGGTGVTSVTTAPTASSFAGWDANKNLSANNLLEGYATTATAAGITTLAVGDKFQQYFTGTSTQTVTFPVTSTLVLGQSYQIVNLSTGVVTINSSGGNQIIALPANTSALVTCILTSGTTAASWSAQYIQVIAGTPNSPTVQKFTSSSGTYTTPTNPAPLYLRVRMVGGGGGGAGGGTADGTVAGDGGNTTFGSSLLTANGGTHGLRANAGGAGGSASISAPGFGTASAGAKGTSGSAVTGLNTFRIGGTNGPSTPFGGGPAGNWAGTADSGTANTGTGGAGGDSGSNAALSVSGSAGGAGGYVEAIIPNPSATYSYAIGAAGTAGAAGTNGNAGGTGGSGYIEVTEYYPALNTGAGNFTVDTFSGDGTTTAFTLTAAPATVNNCQVFISGVYQNKSTYTISSTTITFTTAPPSGTSNIQVNTGLAVAINTPADGTVTYAKLNSSTFVSPTVQKFISGSAATYTTPTSPRTPLYIRVKMVGGGGGGGGSGTTSGTAATAGNNSTFGTSLLTAPGGSAGARGAAGGTGGAAATVNSPALDCASRTGSDGSAAGTNASITTVGDAGGTGGASGDGGGGTTGGAGSATGGGANAATNSGGGGGGASDTNISTGQAGSGGGGGAYVEAIIPSPSVSYLYTVGTGGSGQAAGTSGAAGGNGAAGLIIVEEYYQ